MDSFQYVKENVSKFVEQISPENKNRVCFSSCCDKFCPHSYDGKIEYKYAFLIFVAIYAIPEWYNEVFSDYTNKRLYAFIEKKYKENEEIIKNL